MGADSSYNLEGAKILLSELLGRLSGQEELRFYKRVRSCFKFQSVVATRVSRDLVPRLSGFNVLFQFLVKLVKVNCRGSGSGRSEVLFRMNRKVRIVPFVREERRDTSGSTRGVIVNEFRKQKEFRPIVLLIVTVNLNILF